VVYLLIVLLCAVAVWLLLMAIKLSIMGFFFVREIAIMFFQKDQEKEQEQQSIKIERKRKTKKISNHRKRS
jgi:Zn-dependent protease with chaperone function